MGRLPGWIAHWREMHLSPDKQIHRPQELYTGHRRREFVPLVERMTTSALPAAAARRAVEAVDGVA
jgi:hypothetical protein